MNFRKGFHKTSRSVKSATNALLAKIPGKKYVVTWLRAKNYIGATSRYLKSLSDYKK